MYSRCTCKCERFKGGVNKKVKKIAIRIAKPCKLVSITIEFRIFCSEINKNLFKRTYWNSLFIYSSQELLYILVATDLF